jgi:hypothetical protein
MVGPQPPCSFRGSRNGESGEERPHCRQPPWGNPRFIKGTCSSLCGGCDRREAARSVHSVHEFPHSLSLVLSHQIRVVIMYRQFATALSFASLVLGQQVGTNTAEKHPSLPIEVCTAAGSCTKESTSVVLDVRSDLFCSLSRAPT